MNRAARKYLRQVKKHLCCPSSQKKEFLRQLEDSILLFCENRDTGYAQIVEQFGMPKDVAEEFFHALDAKAVSRFAYIRLRTAYVILTAVFAAAILMVAVSTVTYVKTQQLASGAHTAGTFVHPDGTECNVFHVKTQYQGRDMWWEYHTCTGKYLYVCRPPEDADGTEPYATDIYLNHDETTIHWNHSDANYHWIRIYDMEDDIQKEG